MFRRILIPYDGSENSRRALDVAIDLTRQYEAAISAVAVVSLPEFAASVDEVDQVREQGRKFYEESLRQAQEAALEAGLSLKTDTVYGHRSEAILEYAKKSRADLIVIGSRGLSAVERYVLGSVSEVVVHHAPCSVLVVR